jgi:radical SAM domain protein
MPRKVWQEKVDKSFDIQPILMQFIRSGYSVEKWSLPTNHMPCYTCKRYYNAINYNGQLVKCTATDDIHKSEFSGWLNDDGTIFYKDDYLHRYTVKAYENDQCLNCRLLPVCMGVCPRNYDPDVFACSYDSIDGDVERDIINMIEREYEANK